MITDSTYESSFFSTLNIFSFPSSWNFTSCPLTTRDRKFFYDIQFCTLEQAAHSIIEACKLLRLNFLCVLLWSLLILLSELHPMLFVRIFIYFLCSMSMIELDPQAMCVFGRGTNIFAYKLLTSSFISDMEIPDMTV